MRSESVWRMLARHTRADAALVVLTAIVVACVSLLVAMLPAIQRDAADESVRDAAAQSSSAITVSVPFNQDFAQQRVLWPDTAATARHMAHNVDSALPASFDAPVTTMVSRALKGGRIDNVDVQVRLAYIDAGEGADAVEWKAGRAPQATATALELMSDPTSQPVVEVGLSTATAALWGVAAGDEVALTAPDNSAVTMRVAGVFEVAPRSAHLLPNLMEPREVGGGDARIAATALLNEESLPAARYVLPPGGLERLFTAEPRIGRITAENAPQLIRDVRALATTRDAFDLPGESTTLRTGIDDAVEQGLAGVAESAARMAIVLAGMIVAAALLLVLGGRELVGRRARALFLLRSRGMGASAIGGAFAVEAALVAVMGLLLAGAVVVGWAMVTDGVRPLVTGWVWAPAIVAVIAPPVIAMVAVVRSGGPAQAGRLGGHRRALRRTVLRVMGEAFVVVLTVVGAVTLRGRGVEAAASSLWSDAPVLGAPALAAAVVGLVAVRLLPVFRRALVAIAQRGTGAVALLAATKSAVAPLAIVTVVVSTAMLAVTAWAGPGIAGHTDVVAEPLVRAESLTKASALVAFSAMSVLAVVVIGAGQRRRHVLSLTRVRVLGMAAGPARRTAAIAAAWPVAVAAVIAVVGGGAIVALVLGIELWPVASSAKLDGTAGWLRWAPILGSVLWPLVLSGLVAVVAGAPSVGERAHSPRGQSLGERMRAI